jgi:CubicO group peptidase (beta-lactamase class C family)
MTIRQLMSHSAGFVYGWDPSHPVDHAYRRAGVSSDSQTLEEMVTKLSVIPLAYQPGTEWRYSVSTIVLARLVEVVSGRRFDDFLAGELFEPLGMTDTAFHLPPEKQDRFTTNYRPGPSGLEKCDDSRVGQFSRPRAFLSGGGGLCSTMTDYLQFTGMLMQEGSWRGERLEPETVRAMRTNVLPAGVGVRFDQLQVRRPDLGSAWRSDRKPARASHARPPASSTGAA